MTGVDDPYEPPELADVVLPAGEWTTWECVTRLLSALEARGALRADRAT